MTRKETLNKAKNGVYDVVIIGGGITGAGIAMDAALRGLKVLLVERGDFASGTSSKSGKLVHGGLRYLEKGHFKLVFEACAERYNLATRIAPHIVKPTMFFVPNYKGYKTSRWLMMVGVWVYTLLAAFRNIGKVKLFSKQEALEYERLLASTGLRGAVSFYDCRAHDSRLVIDVLKSAHQHGADLLNYCAVRSINLEGKTKEVIAHDIIADEKLTIKAQVIINAGGAWADKLIALAGESRRFNLKNAKGVHILLERKRLNIATTVGWESPRDNRNLYIVPWRDTLLVGTTDTFYHGSGDDLEVASGEIDYLLEALNKLFPQARLTKGDIIATYAGIRPLIGSDQGISEDDLSRDFEIICSQRGMVSISGGKLTTYRLMARKALAEAYRLLDKPFRKDITTAIAGGNYRPANAEKHIAALIQEHQQSPALVRKLFARYGLNAAAILRRISAKPKLARRIAPDCAYVWGEIDYFAAQEFVESIGDVLWRHTPLALFNRDNCLGVVEDIAEYIGGKLGWSNERRQNDLAAYRRQIAKMRKAYAGDVGLSCKNGEAYS